MKRTIAVLSALAGIAVVACAHTPLHQRVAQKVKESQATVLTLPHLDRAPRQEDYSFIVPQNFPAGQPGKISAPQELDVRSGDLSSWNFSEYTAEELADVLTFDSKTRFPSPNKMPRGFDAKKLLENGKNPGLGVRALHARGLTGKGVSVVVIDQTLLTSHREYADRVLWYEESSAVSGDDASMHGAAVASILLGKTVGMAPQANLFYFAAEFKKHGNRFDARPVTQTLQKIQQLNKRLSPKDKIRVISISRGFSPDDTGAEEFSRIQKELEGSGVLVLTTNDVFTLSRTHATAAPDNISAYSRPAYWRKKEEYTNYASLPWPLVPTDFRTTASPTGDGDYVTYANGGLSWAVPYLAGLYALAVQANPAVTPGQFRRLVRQTAQPRDCEFAGEKFHAAKLVHPAALIEAVRGLKQLQR